MGFGDERGVVLQGAVEAAQQMADTMYPDMAVVPGGDHRFHNEIRRQTAERAAVIFTDLEQRGIPIIEQVISVYGGKE